MLLTTAIVLIIVSITSLFIFHDSFAAIPITAMIATAFLIGCDELWQQKVLVCDNRIVHITKVNCIPRGFIQDGVAHMCGETVSLPNHSFCRIEPKKGAYRD